MRVLIFGTVYADTLEKFQLAQQWVMLHKRVNPDCDLVLVDSSSIHDGALGDDVQVLQFNDNIGHLSRNGQDGWGRAFCEGLIWAIDRDYDFVVHIEGDSLFRHPVMKFCEFMQNKNLLSFVTSVNGTKTIENNWIETGIMFFSTNYLVASEFIERYNWPDGASKRYPHTPEAVIWEMLRKDYAFSVVPITPMRDDCHRLTTKSVKHYDWITHTTPEVYQAFIESVVSSENA